MRKGQAVAVRAAATALVAATAAGCGSTSDTGAGTKNTPAAPVSTSQTPGQGESTAATPTTSPDLSDAATGKLGSRARITTYREDDKTEVEVELHSAASGQVWNLSFSHAGQVFSRGQATTVASEGGGTFSINRLLPHDAGGHMVTVQLTNDATGESITVAATH